MGIIVCNRTQRQKGWTLAEVMVAVAILAILLVSLFAGFALGFGMIKATREDLRATQILTQKIESIRLCTYSELTNQIGSTFHFQEPYSTTGTNSSGLVYYGTISVGPNTNLPVAYQGQVRLVTVSVTWTTGKSGGYQSSVAHTRTMQTQSAYYGLQNYLYGVTNSI